MEELSIATHRRLNQCLAILLIICLGVTLFALARTSHWPLMLDATNLHYAGWRVLCGDAPYRDFFDLNFPGSYLIHAAVVAVPGDADRNWRWFDYGLTAVTAALIAGAVADRGRLVMAFAVTAYTAFVLDLGAAHTGQRDTMVFTLQLAGLLVIRRSLIAPESSSFHVFAAMIFFGAAVTIKPFAALLPVALVPLIGFHAGTLGNKFAATSAALLGVALAPLIILAWLAVSGGLEAFILTFLDYTLPLYPRIQTAKSVSATYAAIFLLFLNWCETPLVAVMTVLPFIISVVTWARASDADRAWLVAYSCGLVHFLVQRRGAEYHAVPAIGFGLIILARELTPLLRRREALVWALAAAALAGCLSPSLFAVARLAQGKDADQVLWKHERTLAMTEFLRPRLRDGDQIQAFDIVDCGADVLFRLRMRNATRYVLDYPFFAHPRGIPFVDHMRADLLEKLKAIRPRFILVNEYSLPEQGYQRFQKFPELADWIDRNYQVAREWPGTRILERIDP